uniref:ATP synthase subunit f, mitochondrial n=1 Tax=Junco hyemalis TaxID=40217 RepID=A0A8C5IBV7_JUNHY
AASLLPIPQRQALNAVRLSGIALWGRDSPLEPLAPSFPTPAVTSAARTGYCAKYIHVKQGGPAGISMLLAGYCLLSYGWNYQHFKRHRWRKYH